MCLSYASLNESRLLQSLTDEGRSFQGLTIRFVKKFLRISKRILLSLISALLVVARVSRVLTLSAQSSVKIHKNALERR